MFHYCFIGIISFILFALPLFQMGPAMAQTGTCAIDIGMPLPDLIVDPGKLKADLVLTTEPFDATDCAVVEGCVSSTGTHLLLRFSSSTPNIGKGDLVIGDPKSCPNLTDAYHFSECHGHYHFKDYSDYRLWTDAGYKKWITYRVPGVPPNQGVNADLIASALQNKQLKLGRKQGFCVIDVTPYPIPGMTTPPQKYKTCGGPNSTGNQGLQVGWSDVYGANLDCQWVEMDGLPDGYYVLEDEVNPERLFPESNYENNSASVRFRFFAPKGNKRARLTLTK